MANLADLSPGTWNVDTSHSVVGFTARHLMISKVRGRFTDFSGVVTIADDPLQSHVEATVDLGSVNTSDDQRDAHLKSADFLDVEKFPTVTFKSSKIDPAGDGEWKASGELNIHGVSRPVVLKVEGPTSEEKDPWGNVRAGASATTRIKRSDFGLTWNAALETGGILVGDDLKIELEVSLIKSTADTVSA